MSSSSSHTDFLLVLPYQDKEFGFWGQMERPVAIDGEYRVTWRNDGNEYNVTVNSVNGKIEVPDSKLQELGLSRRIRSDKQSRFVVEIERL